MPPVLKIASFRKHSFCLRAWAEPRHSAWCSAGTHGGWQRSAWGVRLTTALVPAQLPQWKDHEGGWDSPKANAKSGNAAPCVVGALEERDPAQDWPWAAHTTPQECGPAHSKEKANRAQLSPGDPL